MHGERASGDNFIRVQEIKKIQREVERTSEGVADVQDQPQACSKLCRLGLGRSGQTFRRTHAFSDKDTYIYPVKQHTYYVHIAVNPPLGMYFMEFMKQEHCARPRRL
jgi:hypothetical protein